MAQTKNQRLEVGKGQISGYISIFLATMALISILCFYYPEKLTTPEFREIYTSEMMKLILKIVVIGSFFFALVSFLLSKKIKWALIGSSIAGVAIIMGALKVQGSVVEKSDWYFGLDWMLLDLLLMTIIFIPLELFFPKNKNQTKFHAEWRTDLVYFIISHLFIQIFGIISQKPAILFFGWIGLDKVHIWIQQLPFLVALVLTFVVTDLFQYWAHRIFHNHVYLWRFHSVHHSTQNMDWLAGSRTHFVDIFFTRAMAFVPLYVLGFPPAVFNIYIVFIAIHAVLIHSNTRINFGFIKYIFATPQYHHWHHCEDPKYYGKNFATVFPFLDMIFGTYYLPGNVWPEGTGVHESQFPKGFIKQTIYPFTKSPFDNNLDMEERSNR
jgi:sterol desaturase/sphingolipid hydroxylase (fatty acid hydroxylase superfamily)/F0F1-type ATP synthase assembly protein I